MGDVSVDVFTIPMVEFDCLGGAKAASQNGTSGNFKILKSNFSLFLVLEKNRFSQKIIIIFAMIYGRVDR